MTFVINGKTVEVGGSVVTPSGTPIRPLTSAEYNTLSEEEKLADIIYAITDDNEPSTGGSSGTDASNVYSEEEVRIGTYFGKPLYRRAFRLSGINITLSAYPGTAIGETGSAMVELIKEGFLDESLKILYDPNLYSLVHDYFLTRAYRTPYTTSAYRGNIVVLSVGGNRTMGPYITANSIRYISGINVSQPFTNLSGTLVLEYTKVSDKEETV